MNESRLRCDPHHHLFPGPSPHFAGDQYLIEELAGDVSTVERITSTVYVQATNFYDTAVAVELQPVGETRWLHSLAAPPELVSRSPAPTRATLCGRRNAAGLCGLMPARCLQTGAQRHKDGA